MSIVVYKTFTKQDIDNKRTVTVDSSTKTTIDTTLANFVTYFKNKHLG
mgnify:CR=1 FL=1